jgi:hypothetical protein
VEFFCVYCKTRKKVDKFIKVNRIKNKYIIDIKKIMEEEEVSFADDKMYLKVLINYPLEYYTLFLIDTY